MQIDEVVVFSSVDRYGGVDFTVMEVQADVAADGFFLVEVVVADLKRAGGHVWAEGVKFFSTRRALRSVESRGQVEQFIDFPDAAE